MQAMVKVRLGDHNSSEELLDDLSRQGVFITTWAREMVAKIEVSPVQHIQLVQRSTRELGFTEQSGFGEICLRAMSFGLALVSPDAPLYMALQASANIASGEMMAFAMKAVSDRDGILRIFLLTRTSSGVVKIDAGPGEANARLDPDFKLMFRLAPHNPPARR